MDGGNGVSGGLDAVHLDPRHLASSGLRTATFFSTQTLSTFPTLPKSWKRIDLMLGLVLSKLEMSRSALHYPTTWSFRLGMCHGICAYSSELKRCTIFP